MTLTLKHWTIWHMMIYHQCKFLCKRIITLEDTAETVTLKIATHFFFCMIFWLLVMPHHTKSGCRRLSGSEDIFWKKLRHMEREDRTGGQTDTDSSVTPSPPLCYGDMVNTRVRPPALPGSMYKGPLACTVDHL